MATLSDEVKLFIVKQLACFYTPSEVAESVKEEFGIDTDRNQTSLYDPTKVKGKNLSKKHKEIFEATRKRFLEHVSDIPLANPAVRIAELSKLYEKAKAKRNDVLAAQHLEQIAKETGGAFTNKIKLAGGDTGDNPVHVVSETPSQLAKLKEKKLKAKSGNATVSTKAK